MNAAPRSKSAMITLGSCFGCCLGKHLEKQKVKTGKLEMGDLLCHGPISRDAPRGTLLFFILESRETRQQAGALKHEGTS